MFFEILSDFAFDTDILNGCFLFFISYRALFIALINKFLFYNLKKTLALFFKKC